MDTLITVSGTDLAKDAILNNYQNAVTTKAAVDALEKATSDLTDTLNASVASVTEADGVVTVTTNGGETSTFEAGDPKSIVSVTTEMSGATFTAKDETSTFVTTNKVRSTFTSSTTFQYHPCMSWEGTQTGELYKCKNFLVNMPTGNLTCGTVNGIDVTTLATKDELNSIDLTDYAKTADLATVATSGSYADLTGTPTLATVATSGSYTDLTNKPTIPAAVTVDSALSSTSTNPVQNKVINTALAGKLSTSGGTMTGRIISTADTALFVPLSKVGITFYRDSNPNTIVGNLTAANYSGTAAKATADASGNTITSTYAKLASPAFTGTPTAPTAAAGTSTTQIATTAFVQTALSSVPSGDTQDVDPETYKNGAATIKLTSPVTVAETSGTYDSDITVDVSALIPDMGKSRTATLIFVSGPMGARSLTITGADNIYQLVSIPSMYVGPALPPITSMVKFQLIKTANSTYCFYSVEAPSDSLAGYMSLDAGS